MGGWATLLYMHIIIPFQNTNILKTLPWISSLWFLAKKNVAEVCWDIRACLFANKYFHSIHGKMFAHTTQKTPSPRIWTGCCLIWTGHCQVEQSLGKYRLPFLKYYNLHCSSQIGLVCVVFCREGMKKTDDWSMMYKLT